ncbi:ABC transporter permease [Dokdonella immobilis]|uniref:ABC-2 type transport system permease protein n=1 Tax=Dokdonella immobilis TaxID=578942 RepID=A0A1I4V6Y5_9GAMM|nr:ABC transporter permease [Dokdonella immobilis]SFM96931.1 ABC-2 type transport system permease protein [Dokdonella immobilis]
MSTGKFPTARLLRCYALEGKYEFLRLLRTHSFVLPSLLFPAMFYLLFGVVLGARRGGGELQAYLLATYGIFGVMGVALFGFGVTIAIERERGFLTLKRALPMPPGALLFAKLAMAMIFATIISLILATLAATLAGVLLDPAQWLLLFAVNVLGVVPFAAIGLCIGTLVSGQAAPAIVNLVYLPMSFLSGLWMPLSVLPDAIGRFAPVWPSYHLGRISLAVLGQEDSGGVPGHVAVLLATTLGCFLLARRQLANAEQVGPG